MKKFTVAILIVVAVFCVDALLSNAQAVDISGTWYMGGPYNIGQKCKITQEGNSVTFFGEIGNKSRGEFINDSTVVAREWEGGLRGTITPDRKRINWANGTWWVRAVTSASCQAWYIWGMGVQLGASHAYAYYNDRANLQKALQYAIENCNACPSCCNSEPINELLNRLGAGASANSLFLDIQNLIAEPGRYRLGLQNCNCSSK